MKRISSKSVMAVALPVLAGSLGVGGGFVVAGKIDAPVMAQFPSITPTELNLGKVVLGIGLGILSIMELRKEPELCALGVGTGVGIAASGGLNIAHTQGWIGSQGQRGTMIAGMMYYPKGQGIRGQGQRGTNIAGQGGYV